MRFFKKHFLFQFPFWIHTDVWITIKSVVSIENFYRIYSVKKFTLQSSLNKKAFQFTCSWKFQEVQYLHFCHGRASAISNKEMLWLIQCIFFEIHLQSKIKFNFQFSLPPPFFFIHHISAKLFQAENSF